MLRVFWDRENLEGTEWQPPSAEDMSIPNSGSFRADRVFADVIKDLEMRSFCFTQVGPQCSDQCSH